MLNRCTQEITNELGRVKDVPKNKSYLGLLETLKVLLTVDVTSAIEQRQKIKEAILLLESVELSGLFGVKSLVTVLNNRKLISISTQTIEITVGNQFENFLISLHQNLLTTYINPRATKAYKAPTWCYTYPINPDAKQVLHPVIQHWQNTHIVSETSLSALTDLTRNVKISDRSHTPIITSDMSEDECDLAMQSAEQEARRSIDVLVDAAKGYSEEAQKLMNTPPSEEEIKIAIVQWLVHNGGQENFRFINLLLEANEFTDSSFSDSEDETIKVNGIFEAQNLNWYIDNEKICFDVFLTANQINYGAGKFIMADENGTIRVLNNIEMDASMETNNKNLPPVLIFQAKLQLELDYQNRKILPTVISMQVSGFSNAVKQPITKEVKSTTKNKKLSSLLSNSIWGVRTQRASEQPSTSGPTSSSPFVVRNV